MESIKSLLRGVVRLLVRYRVRGVSRLRKFSDSRLAPMGGIEWRDVGPCRIALSHTYEATRNMAYGSYEPAELRALAGLIEPGDTVADVGANVGFFSAHFAQMVGPTGKVYAFEPGPTPLKSLREVAESNEFRNIDVVSSAVSDRSGSTLFYETEVIIARGYGRIDIRPTSKFKDISEFEVPVTRLDEFFEPIECSKLSLVKLDVEGQERQAVFGMQRLFDSGLRPILMTEVTVSGEYLADLERYGAYLLSLGYRMCFPANPKRDISIDELKPGAHINVLWICSSSR